MTNVEVGFLGFGTGLNDDAISALMGELQTVHRTAQALLEKNTLSFSVEVDGFDAVKKGVNETEKELTSAQKAVKLYTAEVREAIALEKTGNATREDTARKIRALTTEVKGQLGSIDKLSSEHRDLTKAMESAGTAALKLEKDQTRVAKAFQDDQVRQYRDAVTSLRTEFERGASSRDDFIRDTQALEAEMVGLRNTLDPTSKAFGGLDRVIGLSARGLQTAEGQVSRLGLSQQVALGHTSRWRDGLTSMQGAVGGLLGGAGLLGLIKITGSFVGEAQKAESAANLFQKAVGRFGLDSQDANALVQDLADTFGVLPSVVQQAALPILRAGGSIEDVGAALYGAGASAAAGGRDIANAMVNIGQAVATGRSELTESADIMVNSSDAYKDYADNIGVSVDALTEQQKVQAYANAIALETRYELEDLNEVMTDQVRAQQNLRTQFAEFRQEIGERFAPALTLGATAAAGLFDSFGGLPDVAQSSVLGIGGITTAVAALGTGANALRLALIPLFAPPAGLIIGAIALAAGLGVAIFNAAKNFEPAADKVKRLADAALEVPPGLDAIKSATSKEELLGSIQTLSETMDGDARVAFQNYATDAVTSAETVGDAVIGVLQGVAVARKTMLEDAIDAQEELLTTLAENVARSQTAFNIAQSTGQDPNENQAIIRLREALTANRELQEQSQKDLNAALAKGDKERSEQLRAQLAGDQAEVNRIIGEIGQELANTPTGRLNIDTSQAQEAQRDLDALTTRYDDLVNLIDNGDASEIEKYFAAGAPGVQKLANGIGAPSDPPSAPGVAGKLSAFQENLQETGRLVTSLSGSMAAQELKLRFSDDPSEAIVAFREIANTAAAAAQQALEEGKPQRAAALLDISDEATARIGELRDGIVNGLEPVDVAFAHTTGGAEDLSTFLSGMATRSNFAAFATSLADGSYAATTSVQSLTGATKEQQEALRQSQIDYRDTQVAVANASSTTDEYLASMMREQKAYADRTRAQRDQVNNWRELNGAGIEAADVAGKTAEQYELQSKTLTDVGAKLKVAENRFRITGDAQAYNAEKAGIYGEALTSLIDAGFDPLDPAVRNYAKRLAEASEAESDAAKTAKEIQEAEEERAEGLEALGKIEKDHAKLQKMNSEESADHQKALEELAETYPELADELAGLITETILHTKTQRESELAAKKVSEATEAMADASSIATEDIGGLIDSLENAVERSDETGDAARRLKADLEALQVARDVGEAFQVLGDMGEKALEYLPEGANAATLAVGGIVGAADSVTAALQDGKLDWKDAFDILDGAIQGVIGLLGEDVPAEVNIAADAIGGAFSGAAAGAQFGPWGAVAGAVIGGLVGLFGGIAEEQKRQIKLQEEFTERLHESTEAADELAEASEAGARGTTSDLLQKKLDDQTPEEFADGNKGKRQQAKLEIVQARIDLIELNEEYTGLMDDARTRLDDINTEIGNLTAVLNDPRASEADKAEAREALADAEQARIDTQTELSNLEQMYGYDVKAVLESAEQAANDLGISNAKLYEALLTGNEEILGQLSPEQREALYDGISAYYAAFGELPEGAAEAAAALGISQEELMEQLDTGTTELDTGMGLSAQSITTSAQQLNDAVLAAFGPEAAGPIIALINQTASDQAAAVENQGTTLSTAAVNSGAISQEALSALTNQLIQLFGPERAGPIIDLINQTSTDMAGALDTQGTTLTTQADTTGGMLGSSVLGLYEGFTGSLLTGSLDAVNASRTSISGLDTTLSSSLGELSNTVLSKQGGLTSTFGSLFDSSRDLLLSRGPSLSGELATQIGNARETVGDESALLALRTADERDALARAQQAYFEAQQDASSRYGPLAARELYDRVADQRKQLQVSLYGSGGFSPFLTTSTSSISGLLGSFFQTQRNTVTREAGSTVGSINIATTGIRNAMNSLLAASSGYSSASGGRNASYRGGGGGGSNARSINAFQSLGETVDPRALGGFGDDFSLSSHLYGGSPEDEFGQDFHRDTFGYGTRSSLKVAPVQGVSLTGRDRTNFLTGIMQGIRDGSIKLQKVAINSAKNAIKTIDKTRKAVEKEASKPATVKRPKPPTGYVYAEDGSLVPKSFYSKTKKPTKTPAKKSNPAKTTSDEVKATIEETTEAIRVFQKESFDFISGASLFNLTKSKGQYQVGGLLKSLLGSRVDFQKGLTESQKEVLAFATQVGQGLEKAVSGGLSSGIKAAMLSGEVVDFKNLMGSVFDSTFDGLFQQISSGVIQKAFGPLLTDLTGDIARGDTKGAAANIAAINAKLPGVTAQIQQLLAPLQAVANIGGTAQTPKTSTGGITLEQRELGGASVYPTWLDPLGAKLQSAADTMWRSAQYNRQTVEMMRAIILSPTGRDRLTGGSSSAF